jgi:hypothetical protein
MRGPRTTHEGITSLHACVLMISACTIDETGNQRTRHRIACPARRSRSLRPLSLSLLSEFCGCKCRLGFTALTSSLFYTREIYCRSSIMMVYGLWGHPGRLGVFEQARPFPADARWAEGNWAAMMSRPIRLGDWRLGGLNSFQPIYVRRSIFRPIGRIKPIKLQEIFYLISRICFQ